jgi:hypothetical protein
MANYNYTPSDQIELQRKMSEALMGNDMRQGLNKGQKTDWGRGLAHMLKSYQGGKGIRRAAEKEKMNTEITSSELAQIMGAQSPEQATSSDMNRVIGNDPNGLVSDMRSGETVQEMAPNLQSPLAQELAMKRQFSAADSAKEHERALELQGVKNQGGGSGSNPYRRVFETNEGWFSLDTRDPDAIPTPLSGKDGAQLTGKYDPSLAEELSKGKSKGAAIGKYEGEKIAGAPEEVESFANVMETVNSLFDENGNAGEGFDGVYGTVEGRLPSFLPSTVDIEASIDQLTSFMSVDARGAMVGSGSISDFEAKILAASATILNDKTISQEKAFKEVKKVKGILERAQARAEGRLPRVVNGGGESDLSGVSDEDLFN